MTQEVAGGTRTTVSLKVNGTEVDAEVEGDETLLHTLRDQLGYTAPRGTCQIGVCGTCTVLVDGKVASSCIMLTAQARGRDITTPEGLVSADGRLSDVQEAFVRKGAYQCSFCIPAMALSVHAALADTSVDHDTDGIREYLAGNLCRCGTYPEILEAVTEVVSSRSQQKGN
jgi:aerobic-type carbon monoxide dehydrogenase small subunit (CoxS/CutS family)